MGGDGWEDESSRLDKPQKCSRKMVVPGLPSQPPFSCYIHMGKMVSHLVSFGKVTDLWDFKEMGYLKGGSWRSISRLGTLCALQPRQPLAGILDFGLAWVGVLPDIEV